MIPFSPNGNHEDFRGRAYSSSGVATGGLCSSVPTPTLAKQTSDSDCSVVSEVRLLLLIKFAKVQMQVRVT